MIQTFYRGEPLPRRWFDLHRRMPCERGGQTVEPPTYWLTVTLPWKQRMWDVNQNALIMTWPRLSIGFRFRVGA